MVESSHAAPEVVTGPSCAHCETRSRPSLRDGIRVVVRHPAMNRRATFGSRYAAGEAEFRKLAGLSSGIQPLITDYTGFAPRRGARKAVIYDISIQAAGFWHPSGMRGDSSGYPGVSLRSTPGYGLRSLRDGMPKPAGLSERGRMPWHPSGMRGDSSGYPGVSLRSTPGHGL
jgi:hypothetical protein